MQKTSPPLSLPARILDPGLLFSLGNLIVLWDQPWWAKGWLLASCIISLTLVMTAFSTYRLNPYLALGILGVNGTIAGVISIVMNEISYGAMAMIFLNFGSLLQAIGNTVVARYGTRIERGWRQFIPMLNRIVPPLFYSLGYLCLAGMASGFIMLAAGVGGTIGIILSGFKRDVETVSIFGGIAAAIMIVHLSAGNYPLALANGLFALAQMRVATMAWQLYRRKST